jgi:hypothetical protein
MEKSWRNSVKLNSRWQNSSNLENGYTELKRTVSKFLTLAAVSIMMAYNEMSIKYVAHYTHLHNNHILLYIFLTQLHM